MDYDAVLNEVADKLHEDKSIAQPWKNYVLKEISVTLAYIHEGRKVSYREAPPDVCNCPVGGKRRDCPVHGGEAR